MRWLIQEFLNEPENSVRMMDALDTYSAKFLLVRVNPDRTLTVIHKATRLPLDDSDEVLEAFIEDENVTVFGSKMIATIADEMGLVPGSFANDNFTFDVFREHLGEELLNHDFTIGELSELEPLDEPFFIRPVGNTKLFTGMVVSKQDFLNWQQRFNTPYSKYIGEPLMVSPVKDIQSEYRFFVVEGRIVASSSYKVGDRVNGTLEPSKSLTQYTEQMIKRLPLAQAFVIDVAETNEGYKVIEYNNFNTSGLYGSDEKALVRAVNRLKKFDK